MKNINWGGGQKGVESKNIVRLFLIIITLGLYGLTLSAESITENEARDKAYQFLRGKDAVHGRGGRVARANDASQLRTAEARDAFFVFNVDSAGGFVVVSGDDRMPAVLGYSYSGTYKPDEIPDNMRAWLEGYAEQYEYLQTHSDAKAVSLTSVSGKKISPLLSCHWNQRAPYNDKCPMINGQDTPTGCTATAMAQIMYFHQWPQKTTAVIPSYTTWTHGIYMPSIGITTIDWENLFPAYSSAAPETQRNAIATLMLLCGASVEMNYGLDGSGASIYEAMLAFSNYFDYDGMLMSLLSRSDYKSDEWNQLIYDEIRAQRPVLYSGFSKDSGHAFVIDGYDANDYFHVNWGWGGNFDNYFLLSALLNFNSSQDAVIGIKGGSSVDYAYSILEDGILTFYYDKKRHERSGRMFNSLPKYGGGSYLEFADEITSIVFDPSFADVHELRDMSYVFYGLKNLKSIEGLEYLDTRNVTDMRHMFRNCEALTSLDVSSFNTQNVTSMAYMFCNCNSLTSLNVSGFNTQNVADMRSMFYNCSKLPSLDVSGFNTQNVTSMADMFFNCNKLSTLDVSGFNTQNVTSMAYIFCNCNKLSTLDVSGFNTQNVTNMNSMFCNCEALTSLDVSGFNTQNVADMRSMFYNCSKLPSLNVSSFNTQNITNMNSMFRYCEALTSLDVSGFNTQNVTDMGSMFYNCSKLSSLDVSSFNTQNVADMAYMFYNCSKLPFLNVSSFNTQNVTNMNFMFYNCSKLPSLDVSSFNTQNVTSMAYMFCNCNSLTSLNVSGFNTQNITNMSSMFRYCEALTSLDVSGFNTQNVTDMGSMFYNCSKLSSLDVSGFNTQNVTSMAYMFCNCNSLTSLNVSGFNTQNVTDMSRMCYGCKALTSIKISGTITKLGDYTFAFCSNLQDFTCLARDVPQLGESVFYGVPQSSATLHVLSSVVDDYKSATGWKNFKYFLPIDDHTTDISLDILEKDILLNESFTLTATVLPEYASPRLKWSSSNPNVASVDDYGTVTGLSDGVAEITVTTTDGTNLSATCQVTVEPYYIKGKCGDDLSYTLDKNNVLTITGKGRMYSYTGTTLPWKDYCAKVVSVSIPDEMTSIGSYAFSGCSALTSITIPESVTSLGTYAFSGCSSLSSVTCLSKNVPTLGSNVFYNVNQSGAALSVPVALLKAYKSAAQWKKFGEILPIYCPATSVAVSPIELNLPKGLNGQLTATILPEDANPLVVWISSDKSVAIVDENGYVTAVGKGTATITATTVDGTMLSARCAVTVEDCIISGRCGNDMIYVLYNDYTLYLSGKGDMNNYSSAEQLPWHDYRSEIKAFNVGCGITGINKYAIVSCSAIERIVVEDGNTKYDSREDCNALIHTTTDALVAGCRNTVIPYNVKSISSYAFCGCSALASITIPEGVTSIATEAFSGCSSLKTLICEMKKVPSMGSNVFKDVEQGDATLVVRESALASYKSAAQWKEFGTIISEEDLPSPLQYYNAQGYELTLEDKSGWEEIQVSAPNAIAIADAEHQNWAGRQTNVLVENASGTYSCRNFLLTDLTQGYGSNAAEAKKTGFYTPVSFTATKGTYKRQAYAGYNTLCLPFDVNASDLSSTAKVFVFDSYNDENNKIIFKAVEETVAAGTPCIVKEKGNIIWSVSLAGKTIVAAQPSADGYMRGTYVTTDTYQGKGYSPRSSDNKFAPLTQYLHPFRACFSLADWSDAAARGSLSAIFVDEDGVTVIDSISAIDNGADAPKTVYTLSGQRIKEIERSGIYIVDGKKQYIEVK